MIKKIRAYLGGYFWLPCPICGEEFGGFECGEQSYHGRVVCYKIKCNVSAAVREFSEGKQVFVTSIKEPTNA